MVLAHWRMFPMLHAMSYEIMFIYQVCSPLFSRYVVTYSPPRDPTDTKVYLIHISLALFEHRILFS